MDSEVVKKKYKKDPRRIHPQLRDDLRHRIFAMQDTCGICGREVDKTLPPGHPLSPEVDEIIPVSRGGSPYDIDNLQLTHKRCNQKKSNTMPEDLVKDKYENPIPISRGW